MRKSLKEILAEQENEDSMKEGVHEKMIEALKESSSAILLFIDKSHKGGGCIGAVQKRDQKAMCGNISDMLQHLAGGSMEDE